MGDLNRVFTFESDNFVQTKKNEIVKEVLTPFQEFSLFELQVHSESQILSVLS